MTLQTQHTVNAPAILSDEQRRRVADALENAQSENTRRSYAGQYRKFRAWCERKRQSPLPVSPRSSQLTPLSWWMMARPVETQMTISCLQCD